MPAPPRILVVEDEELVRDVVARSLARHGYEVETAGSSAEALERLAGEGPYAIVLSDVVMPGRSGLELAREIERGWPDVRVLLMTGYADVASEEGRRTRFPILRKPFTAADLLRAVRDALRDRPGEGR